MSTKTLEAENHCKQAEKLLRRDYFALRFRPDACLAASEFDLAASLFREAGESRRASQCWEKCGDLRFSQMDHFGAGRSYESAAQVLLSTEGDLSEVLRLNQRAYDCYVNDGKIDTVLRLVRNTVDLLQERHASDAEIRRWFDSGIHPFNLHQDTESYNITELIKRYAGYLADNSDWEACDRCLESGQEKSQSDPHNYGKFAACRFVIALVLGRITSVTEANEWLAVAAGRNLAFSGSKVYQTIQDWVEACEENSAEHAERTLRALTTQITIVEIARLANEQAKRSPLRLSISKKLGSEEPAGGPRLASIDDENDLR